MMVRFFMATMMALGLAGAGRADPPAPGLATLTELSTAPYLSRPAFLDRLSEALPRLIPGPATTPAPAEGDPYWWAIEARFGEPMDDVRAPGGVVLCARYGRLTQEAMAQLSSTEPGAFQLWQQAVILSDDAVAWPDAAVARLACSITWDDGRRVAPLAPGPARETLLTLFDAVTLGPDPRERPGQVRVFGPGGYRMAADGRVEDTGFQLDLFEIEQLATHHLILFRSYLMGGGV